MSTTGREHHEVVSETLEPLDEWVHLQPSIDEDRKGKIYLPANIEGSRLQRCLVLSAGLQVSDLVPGDVVLVLSSKAIDLRDGTRLAQRDMIVARMQ